MDPGLYELGNGAQSSQEDIHIRGRMYIYLAALRRMHPLSLLMPLDRKCHGLLEYFSRELPVVVEDSQAGWN